MQAQTYILNYYDNVLDTSTPLWLHDGYRSQKRLDFHIRSGDYFATLATILDLMRQEIGTTSHSHAAKLRALTKDLMYLQKHYQLVEKYRNDTACYNSTDAP